MSSRTDLQPDTPQLLDRTHVALRDLLVKNQIDEYDYFKAIVSLAARWIVLEMNEDATELICELTPAYIEVGLPFQMVEDGSFRELAHFVARALSQSSPDMTDEDVQWAILLSSKPKARA
jgi:hypothetical protein